jgi:cysteine desulfurase
MKKIYLDNAATTPVDKKVLIAMDKNWNQDFGNPSSIHSFGVEAKKFLQKSRENIATFLNVRDKEVFFTSGGTEANNLAIFGLVNSVLKTGKKYSDIHLITTEIEHSSVLACFDELVSKGCKVDYLSVDEFGIISTEELRTKIRPETLLVSVGYANSEIGVVQPIKEIIKVIRHKRKELNDNRFSAPFFHIDASQAGLYLNVNAEELGVDLMTIDAQKMYGPKGVGALFVREGIKIEPIVFGGGQEKNKRSGTENIPLIVGLAKACELAMKNKESENKRLTKIKDYFFKQIQKIIPNVIINGHLNQRLPNNINLSISGQDGEMLVFKLDAAGIICSSSSACASGSGESIVVRKIAEKTKADKKDINARAKSVLRFSMGIDTTIGNMKTLLKILKHI